MPGLLYSSYFCEFCNKPYDNKNLHKCSAKCSSCFHMPACYHIETIVCDECNRRFKSKRCFDNHKKVVSEPPNQVKNVKKTSKKPKILASSICEKYCRCRNCFKQILTKNLQDHLCGYSKCKFCKQDVEIASKSNIKQKY